MLIWTMRYSVLYETLFFLQNNIKPVIYLWYSYPRSIDIWWPWPKMKWQLTPFRRQCCGLNCVDFLFRSPESLNPFARTNNPLSVPLSFHRFFFHWVHFPNWSHILSIVFSTLVDRNTFQSLLVSSSVRRLSCIHCSRGD